MKRILFTMLLAASLSAEAQTQTYETEFARPLNEVLTDIQSRFPYSSLFRGRVLDECIGTFRL